MTIEDHGQTALQDKIATLLRAASIPEPYINSIVGIVECGERERQYAEDVDMLWERYRCQSEQSTTGKPEPEPLGGAGQRKP